MYRVLIADDERIEREVLYKTLATQFNGQCVIWQAENGREALALFDEHDIQIAILDIEMPGINGLEAAKEMRLRKEDCCIVFLTAYDDFTYAKKAITIRVLDYLLKPYQDEELIGVVEEAMRLTNKAERISEGGSVFEGGEKLCLGAVQDGVEEGGGSPVTEEGYAGRDAQQRLKKVAEVIREYIEENYYRDLSMQDVARVMNYSEAYFCKLFKQCFEKNFTTYLAECRVEAAKKLLERPTTNIKEIGEAVGYQDSNYFARVFKRVTGVSPTEYRASIFGEK